MELAQLKRATAHDHDEPGFQKQLLVIIGAYTREISKMVIALYHKRRMSALDRLMNTSCRTGPKMDSSIAGGSRSRTDDSMSDISRSSRAVRKSLAINGGFATERAWIDSRLAYRRIVYKMIKDIESHCDDVVCLSQNFLKLTQEQFGNLCNQENVDMIVSQTESELQVKQASLRNEIAEMAAGSDSESDLHYESAGDMIEADSSSYAGISDNNGTTRFNSASSPNEDPKIASNISHSEESKRGLSGAASSSSGRPSDNSYRSDFSSVASTSGLDKKRCLEILQAIIAVKRE